MGQRTGTIKTACGCATGSLTTSARRRTGPARSGRFRREEKDRYFRRTACRDYIELLADQGETASALECFRAHREELSGDSRTFYELGARLILAGCLEPENLWEEMLPHIQADMGRSRLALINCEPLIRCAGQVGDGAAARKLQRYHRRERERCTR